MSKELKYCKNCETDKDVQIQHLVNGVVNSGYVIQCKGCGEFVFFKSHYRPSDVELMEIATNAWNGDNDKKGLVFMHNIDIATTHQVKVDGKTYLSLDELQDYAKKLEETP